MGFTIAAVPGWGFADAYVIGLAFLGAAVFAAVFALSHQHERAFSASVIYLGLGLLAASVIDALGVQWLDPFEHPELLEHAAEFAVIVALFATGMRLDRPFGPRGWTSVLRLLALVMPLTIAAVALFGVTVMGLSFGAALILGAVLAPTDPVLAGDVGVGPPGDEDEREPNFSLTAEAGLNDGLAFPFVLAGVLIVSEPGEGWVAEWLSADVLYAIALAVLLGALGGRTIAASISRLREHDLLDPGLDGWVALAATLLVYGITEIAGAYGFLAVFVAGLAFRRYERDHEMHKAVHDGAEVVEKFSELALVLLLGSLVSFGVVDEPGVGGWLLTIVLLLLIRPVATAIGFTGSRLPKRERVFIGWFGVRGIGSLYYVAAVLGLGVLDEEDARTIFWTVAATVVVSIIVHGITATPVARRTMPDTAHDTRA